MRLNNSKILITGGAGFIGHHIIYKLLKETNCNIISLDRLDYSGSYNRINEIINNNKEWSKRIIIVWHDLKAEINFLNETGDDVGNNNTHRTEDAYTLKWNYTGGGTSETYNIYLNHYEGQSQWGVGTFSRLIATVFQLIE